MSLRFHAQVAAVLVVAANQACSRAEPNEPRVTPAKVDKKLARPVETSPRSAPSSASAGDSCARMCSLMEALHCPHDPSDCYKGCDDMRTIPVCKAEMERFIACAAAGSASDARCNSDGEAELRDGVCETEQAAVASCMERAG